MIEETSLIQLKNYRPHPTNERYLVFIYHDYRMACKFEDGLSESNIDFEKDVTENGPNKRFLYAIHRRDLAQAKQCNNLAVGTYRKPFIADPVLRYTVIALSIGLIALAVIGYIKSN